MLIPDSVNWRVMPDKPCSGGAYCCHEASSSACVASAYMPGMRLGTIALQHTMSKLLSYLCQQIYYKRINQTLPQSHEYIGSSLFGWVRDMLY